MQKYRAKVNISTGEIPHRLAGWHRKVNTVTLLTHTSHNMATATTIDVVSPIFTSNLHATFVDLIKKNTVNCSADNKTCGQFFNTSRQGAALK